MDYDKIINELTLVNDAYNELHIIPNYMVKNLKEKLGNNITELIIEDYKIVMKIIDFYYDEFINKINMGLKYEEVINNMTFIDIPSNSKKNIYIKFNNIILPWLKTTNFFKIVKPLKIFKFIPNLDWCRPNQKKSIDVSIDNNFNSGIDFQCMGAGKTNIILAKANIYSQLYNKNIIIMCEKKYIIENEFSIENLKKMNSNIIDLTKVNIINLALNKDNKYNENIKGNNNIIIVHRAFLSSDNKYLKLKQKDNFGLVLIDECHSATADITLQILKYFKQIGMNLIGFSATPIRNNKLKEFNELFIINKKINILSNYSLFNAISDYDENHEKPFGCLPFKIVLHDNKNKTPDKILEYTNHIMIKLHYKKIIFWFRKIDECEDVYKYFKKNFNNKSIKLYISHSKSDEISDMEFINRESNCIMFSVGRFREGTNMKTAEVGFLLDADKNRGEIPTLQMCGRLIRFDDKLIKKKGIIIDFCSKSDIIKKIIDYYARFNNDEKFEDLLNYMKSSININQKKRKIFMKINEKHQIELKFKTLEINWETIQDEIFNYINEMFGFNIFRVPIGTLSLSNYNKSIVNKININNIQTSVWGCKEVLAKHLKKNDKLIFDFNERIEIYNVNDSFNNPKKGKEIWGDETYSKIFPVEYIVTESINRKELNKLIGYKENYVPRTITPIKIVTCDFKKWFDNICKTSILFDEEDVLIDNDESNEEEEPITYDHKKLKKYFKACEGNLNTNYYKQYFGSKSKEEFDRNDFTVLISDVVKELGSTSSHDTNAVIKLINYLLKVIDEDDSEFNYNCSIKMLNKTKKLYMTLNKEIEL
jgi:superfamily II DNA or RNA helicase